MQDSNARVGAPDWLKEIRWNTDGLIPAIAQDAATGDILMMAWMNAESLRLTAEEGQAAGSASTAVYKTKAIPSVDAAQIKASAARGGARRPEPRQALRSVEYGAHAVEKLSMGSPLP